MKKFLIIMFITVSTSGLLFSVVSYAAQPASTDAFDPSGLNKIVNPNSIDILPSTPSAGPINAPVAPTTANYTPLAPITPPGGQPLDTVAVNNFPAYLQAIYKIGIGACFVLGVIMFTWAGIEYIVSEAMSTKADAIKRINGALIGLAIALVSYILLYTINPDLLKLQNINTQTTTNTTAQ